VNLICNQRDIRTFCDYIFNYPKPNYLSISSIRAAGNKESFNLYSFPCVIITKDLR